jgi:hypothetical protein
MIQMPVREQNRFDRLWWKAKPFEKPPDENRFADQTSVNHHAVIAILQQKAAAHEAAKVKKIWRTISHGSGITDISINPAIQKNALPCKKNNAPGNDRWICGK